MLQLIPALSFCGAWAGKRRRRVGLVHQERQLARGAAAFRPAASYPPLT
ncbi:MAG TPA: hypothetical protein VKB45_07675 [Gemmatimonadales bacterium]|nr:hypothetical protein [Gemmatimonadales bacterium]